MENTLAECAEGKGVSSYDLANLAEPVTGGGNVEEVPHQRGLES